MANAAEEAKTGRQQLPAPMQPRDDVSLWSVLKNCIGKELSKITMPVVLNEPLSFLQRICEYMEYAYLLTEACQHDDPADRMKFVAAFAVSALASNWERLGKPFNPLLGETYELQCDGYSIICEQVSHHPPVSAFHAESPDFKFHGSIYPKLKFWGKSVEIMPKGIITLELKKFNEVYTWSNVNCCVHNVIVGKLWIEQYGSMEITNHSNGHRVVLNFKDSSSSAKDLHRVEGFVQDKDGRHLLYLYGKWTEFIKSCPNKNYEEYVHKNAQQRKADKGANESAANTPKKVFSKLNSFKLNSFRSLSIQDNDGNAPGDCEGDIPRSSSAYSIDIEGSELLWKCSPRPENSSLYYQFTLFAMQLNEMLPNMNPPNTLCPTDSRLRPDIRCLEKGDVQGASQEKERLEEKQRDARRTRKHKGHDTWKPRWFEKTTNPYTKLEDWHYVGGFWDRNYAEIEAIF